MATVTMIPTNLHHGAGLTMDWSVASIIGASSSGSSIAKFIIALINRKKSEKKL
jgi:hypothetical protein